MDTIEKLMQKKKCCCFCFQPSGRVEKYSPSSTFPLPQLPNYLRVSNSQSASNLTACYLFFLRNYALRCLFLLGQVLCNKNDDNLPSLNPCSLKNLEGLWTSIASVGARNQARTDQVREAQLWKAAVLPASPSENFMFF